jgi:hypothetical protein
VRCVRQSDPNAKCWFEKTYDGEAASPERSPSFGSMEPVQVREFTPRPAGTVRPIVSNP